MVSHKRICQYIREDKTKGSNLYKNLRHKLKHRKRSLSGKHKVPIDQRLDIINNKQHFGDWEIDLIVGKNNKGAMLTLIKRSTAMIMIHKLKKEKQAQSLAKNCCQYVITL